MELYEAGKSNIIIYLIPPDWLFISQGSWEERGTNGMNIKSSSSASLSTMGVLVSRSSQDFLTTSRPLPGVASFRVVIPSKSMCL